MECDVFIIKVNQNETMSILDRWFACVCAHQKAATVSDDWVFYNEIYFQWMVFIL